MPITISGTTGISLAGQFDSASSMGFKNRIINGAMVIDQRNAGASFTPTDQTYSLDRWKCRVSQASKYTVQQNAGAVTPPAGFKNYLGVTSSSAYSIGASDYFSISQIIEGLNFYDLAWGTASASTITISFWVRSSLTGTFGGALQNSAEVRSYPFTYTISVANTWEQKSVTIAGDQSGTWLTTNGIGLYMIFGLGVGSTYSGTAGAWAASSTILSATGATSVVGTNGATFYITGVQLEKGSTATSFDYRPIGTELALCQRYFQKVTGMMGAGQATTTVSSVINFSVEMRASPTVSLSAAAKFSDFTTADYTQSSASAVINSGTRVTPQGVFVNFANFTGLTLNRPIGMIPNESGILLISSEL